MQNVTHVALNLLSIFMSKKKKVASQFWVHYTGPKPQTYTSIHEITNVPGLEYDVNGYMYPKKNKNGVLDPYFVQRRHYSKQPKAQPLDTYNWRKSP